VNILICYYSETGNTEKVAQAIAEEAAAQGHTTDLRTAGEVQRGDLDSYDLVFLGSTVHSSDVAAPIRNLLDGMPESASFKLAGFATHATLMPGGEDWHTQMYEKWASRAPETFRSICEAKGIKLVGYFHCQGVPSPPIEQFIRTTIIPDDEQWATYIEEVRKHPTSDDLEAARAFAAELLSTQ